MSSIVTTRPHRVARMTVRHIPSRLAVVEPTFWTVVAQLLRLQQPVTVGRITVRVVCKRADPCFGKRRIALKDVAVHLTRSAGLGAGVAEIEIALFARAAFCSLGNLAPQCQSKWSQSCLRTACFPATDGTMDIT